MGCWSVSQHLSDPRPCVSKNVFLQTIQVFRDATSLPWQAVCMAHAHSMHQIEQGSLSWENNTQWSLIFICLFGVLHRFQHCTGHIMTGSWKGRGNQYIEFARVVYCKLPTNGKQLPAFPLEPVRGSNPGLRGGKRDCYHSATMAPSGP